MHICLALLHTTQTHVGPYAFSVGYSMLHIDK